MEETSEKKDGKDVGEAEVLRRQKGMIKRGQEENLGAKDVFMLLTVVMGSLR